MKDIYNQLQTESIRDTINGHSDHLKSLEERCTAIEQNLSTAKHELEGMVEEKLKNVTKLETKGLAKEIRAKITEEMNTKLENIAETVDSQIERLKSEYKDLSENMLRARVITEKPKSFSDLSESVHASLGLIVQGPVKQLQRFLDDAEMIYGLKTIYAKDCTYPYRLEITMKKPGED